MSCLCRWVLEIHKNQPEFLRKTILTDETHFHLAAIANKEKLSHLGSGRFIVEKPLQLQHVTVRSGRINEPYFFGNAVGATVAGNDYGELINDFFWPELEGIDVDNFYFQQNGATCKQRRQGKSF